MLTKGAADYVITRDGKDLRLPLDLSEVAFVINNPCWSRFMATRHFHIAMKLCFVIDLSSNGSYSTCK